jgi:beta-ureidopropionase / N-carbamoyl-L-amino-acid hydrolase
VSGASFISRDIVISLQELNAQPALQFIATLTGVFEHSPWVAGRVASARPFASVLQLHAAMCAAVGSASPAEQLALIRAHPELAGRAAIRGELTPQSADEQQGAGLQACSPQEFARLQELNAAYARKFGFPFVLAVKGHTRSSVLAAMQQRTGHGADEERATALAEIGRITRFRLAELVTEPPGARIIAMAQHLARFSEDPQALTCSYLTSAHRATAAEIRDFMLSAGLEVSSDAVGNVIGRWRAAAGAGGVAATLVTGSHYDTVVNAGKFDGRLGILLPIVVAADLRRAGTRLPFTLSIVAFAEEEGVRFRSTFLGSRALTGTFETAALASVDAGGTSLRQTLKDAGLDPAAIPAAALDPATLLGFIEVHIEQGPVLLEAGAPVGVVTSIAGSIRGSLTIVGLSGHSGTVPMGSRRDAAAAAAQIVLAVERRCSGTPGLVGTVGQLQVPGGAMNVIPGRCELSIDIRAERDAVRTAALADVMAEVERICAARRVSFEWRKVLETASVPASAKLQRRWAQSIQRAAGIAAPLHLPSGAGHDAMVMAGITEMGMLFVRCGNGGISHHPDESLTAEDAEVAARVFADFLLHYAAT